MRRHRLAVLLAPHAGALGLPTETAAQVVQESLHQQRLALPLIALALELLPALERSGLRALLLKGPALAVQTTGQGSGRDGCDLDLLVPPGDAPAGLAPASAPNTEYINRVNSNSEASNDLSRIWPSKIWPLATSCMCMALRTREPISQPIAVSFKKLS